MARVLLCAGLAASLAPQKTPPVMMDPKRRGLCFSAGAAALLGGVGDARAAKTYQPEPLKPMVDQKTEADLAAALEKAVKETTAATVAAVKVTEEFLNDPATKKLVGDASQVALDAGTAAGKAVLDLARNTDVNSITRSAQETADVLSLPVRLAEAASKDDAPKAISQAVDAWTKTPGVRDLAAASATTASALKDEALKASAAALDDVSKRAESGQLVEDAKNVARVAGDVTSTIGLDKAASGVATAVGSAAVDVLTEAFGGGNEEKIAASVSKVGESFKTAAGNAPGVAGFAAGFLLNGLLNVGKDPQIAYQEREIKRLKDELGTVTGIKSAVASVQEAVASVQEAVAESTNPDNYAVAETSVQDAVSTVQAVQNSTAVEKQNV